MSAARMDDGRYDRECDRVIEIQARAASDFIEAVKLAGIPAYVSAILGRGQKNHAACK
jgi:hypothetical protein